MNNFTPVAAAVGGALIGLATVLLMMLTGRVAGISGICGGLLSLPSSDTTQSDRFWRLAFVVGLILAPLTGTFAGYTLTEPQLPSSWPVVVVAASWWASGPASAVAVRRAMAFAALRVSHRARSWPP